MLMLSSLTLTAMLMVLVMITLVEIITGSIFKSISFTLPSVSLPFNAL